MERYIRLLGANYNLTCKTLVYKSFCFKELSRLIVDSVEVMSEIRKSIREKSQIPVVLSGCVGPRGDGYKVGSTIMTSQEAEDYHSKQIATMALETDADLVSISSTFNEQLLH